MLVEIGRLEHVAPDLVWQPWPVPDVGRDWLGQSQKIGTSTHEMLDTTTQIGLGLDRVVSGYGVRYRKCILH